jgi:hypothetical protein
VNQLAVNQLAANPSAVNPPAGAARRFLNPG